MVCFDAYVVRFKVYVVCFDVYVMYFDVYVFDVYVACFDVYLMRCIWWRNKGGAAALNMGALKLRNSIIFWFIAARQLFGTTWPEHKHKLEEFL